MRTLGKMSKLLVISIIAGGVASSAIFLASALRAQAPEAAAPTSGPPAGMCQLLKFRFMRSGQAHHTPTARQSRSTIGTRKPTFL